MSIGTSTLLLLISGVVMVNVYLATHSQVKRPEIFYGAAALMLFAGFLAVAHQ